MKVFTFILALLLYVIASTDAASNGGTSRTWITDVTIISPENLEHIVACSVLIENWRIIRVDRKAGPKKAAGATVVSGKGLFLIPGLIDSHVHLASIPGLAPEMSPGPADGKSAMIKKYFEQLPRSYLYFGYLTVVDLAVVDQRRRESSL